MEFATKRPPLAERKRKAEEQSGPAASAKAPRTGKGADKPTAAVPMVKAAQQKPMTARVHQPKPAVATPGRVKAAAGGRNAATAEKQRLVMTVAIGGIPPGRRDAVTKLAMSVGKVSWQLLPAWAHIC